MKHIISTSKAPAAIGPYSQGVVSNGLLFTSGQLPIDPETGTIPDGSIEEKAHIAFRNLSAPDAAIGVSRSGLRDSNGNGPHKREGRFFSFQAALR